MKLQGRSVPMSLFVLQRLKCILEDLLDSSPVSKHEIPILVIDEFDEGDIFMTLYVDGRWRIHLIRSVMSFYKRDTISIDDVHRATESFQYFIRNATITPRQV